MKLIDLLAPLLILADFVCREFARRADRDASAPMSEASPERARQQPAQSGVRLFAGIYVRDDEH